jgi:DNA invertase Pin-like site-specific DNA recombinase
MSSAKTEGLYDWNDPFARTFLQILTVIAEFEASLIRQRTREGIDIARQNGVTGGRARGGGPLLLAPGGTHEEAQLNLRR